MRAIVGALLLAACTDTPPAEPDAGGYTLASGTYALDWECIATCSHGLPAQYLVRLHLDLGDEGALLAYEHASNPEQDVDVTATWRGRCVESEGFSWPGYGYTESYVLCPIGDGVLAGDLVLVHETTGVRPRWRVTGLLRR